METKDYKYLDYANGWSEEPSLVKEAREKGYQERRETLGRGLTRYYCDELKYYYDVDSSD